MKSHWKRWLLGGLAVVIVLAVGGPFVFIHFIEGPPPKKLAITSDFGTASDASSTGSWTVTSGSTVGYRVKEILFGQSTTAVGRTGDVTGSATIDGSTVTRASFTAKTTTLQSDQSERDEQVQGRILETSQYPTGGFTLSKPIVLSSLANGVESTGTATGQLNLHGVTKVVTFTVTAKREGGSLQVSGSIPIVFADYGIDNPSGGPAQTADNGTLEFLLMLTKG